MSLQHVPPRPPGDPSGRRADEGGETMTHRRRIVANSSPRSPPRKAPSSLASGCRPRAPAAQTLGTKTPATPEINAWIVISPDDTVTIRIAQTELGQGVWTSNAMMVCEELQCDWSKVRPQYASANRDAREKAPEWTLKVPGNGATDPKGGGEPTFGNRDPHRRVWYPRQSLSAHADERGVLRERRPLLSAACRSRSARTAAAAPRRSCGTCRSPSSPPKTASSRMRRAAARRRTARSPIARPQTPHPNPE